MNTSSGQIDDRRTAEIYKAFLQLDEIAELLSIAGDPQIFLDHMVGFYLEGGEDALHDPRAFSRVMHMRDALLKAADGNYSQMPKLGHDAALVDGPDYEMFSDMIRLASRGAGGLSDYAKQIHAALPTVLQNRSISG